MSDFVAKRSLLISNVENLLENISSRRESKKNEADDLFDFGGESTSSDFILQPIAQNKSKLDLLMMEKEILGLYVSGNPLAEYQDIVNWLRLQTDEPNLHLVLVEKIKKIFTKNGKMMLGMNITTTNEQLEGVVYSKNTPELSSILTEKEIFWVKGLIRDPEQKKRELEEEADPDADSPELTEVKEFVESKKLVFELASPFVAGINKIIAGATITLEIKNTLDRIDWQALLSDPKNLVTKTQKNTQVEILLDSKFTLEQIKWIKSRLKKQPNDNDYQAIISVEHGGKIKKVAGEFFVTQEDYAQILKVG
jgi:DNA polymerase III alpha subunit